MYIEATPAWSPGHVNRGSRQKPPANPRRTSAVTTRTNSRSVFLHTAAASSGDDNHSRAISRARLIGTSS